MPKEAKTAPILSRRSAPYSVTTTKAIAPSSSSSTTMASHATTTSHPATADRHATQTWPPEKDELLMRARHQGLNWQPIATQYFPDKTANACRKRHERLMEKRNNSDSWDPVKMENLARAYVSVREQMWKILADEVGEKWQNVEAKVCIHPNANYQPQTTLTKPFSAWKKGSKPSKQPAGPPHGANGSNSAIATSSVTRSQTVDIRLHDAIDPSRTKTKSTKASTTAPLAQTQTTLS